MPACDQIYIPYGKAIKYHLPEELHLGLDGNLGVFGTLVAVFTSCLTH
jgi:hypothetical protein